MKWLVTAFEPFDQASSNSSLIVARELEKINWRAQVYFSQPLPVTFQGAWPALERTLNKHKDIAGVLALGQAESRTKISLERVALNWIDARIPDNDGMSPNGIVQAGPDIYWSGIPWPELERPKNCEVSYSAGTFVCNALMYQLMDWAKRFGKVAGFVHVPLLNSQTDLKFANLPRLEDQEAVQSLSEILKFLLELQ